MHEITTVTRFRHKELIMTNPAYNLLKELHAYNESSLVTAEEKKFIEECITFMAAHPSCFERSCKGHFTGSAWVVNHDYSRVLLTHHKKLNRWLQLGGHADGDTNIQRVALREAREESGTEKIELLISTIFDIDIHPIPSACERHYDIIYLLHADKDATIEISDESHALAWVPLEDITHYTQERSIIRKLEKFIEFKKSHSL